MDTIFSLKSKKSVNAANQAISHNNAMMRLKMQNALIQQELNKVKAANAALALEQQQQQQQQQQQREHEARVALAAQQQREHEARVALAAHQREHEARVALAAQQHREHREHEARVALSAQQEVVVAPPIKKSKFGKLLSNMNKRN